MHFLTRVEKLLDLGPAEKSRVMRELTSHYYELRDELVASGMDAGQAAEEAGKRLGDPADVAAQLGPIHNSASWKSALLATVPFAGSILAMLCAGVSYTAGVSATILVGGVAASVSARELRAGRRPIWLATWLAMCFFTFHRLIGVFSLGTMTVAPTIMTQHNREALYAALRWGLVGSILASVVMIAVLWRNRRWRIAVGLLGTGQVCSAVFCLAHFDPIGPAAYLIGSLGGRLAAGALTTLFAWRVFASHRYGSAAQASLFLFACGAVGSGVVSGGNPAVSMVSPCILGAMVVWFARSGSSLHKLAIVSIGVLLRAALQACILLQYNRMPLSLQQGTILSMATTTIVFTYPQVLAPFVIDRIRRRRDRLQIAQ